MDEPERELAEKVQRLLGSIPVAWRPASGGYTAAQRWIVTLADGRTAFVKAAVPAGPRREHSYMRSVLDTSLWLRAEWRVYSQVQAPFLPAVLGWEDEELPILILEDLSDAYWPPPWPPGMVEAVLRTLEQLAATPTPPDLPPISNNFMADREWLLVERDPAPFLSIGFCSPAWLEMTLPVLLAAQRSARLDGDAFVHCDIRSDNLCLRGTGSPVSGSGSPVSGHQVYLVDWNWACTGNPKIDIAGWLPSLRTEGGPRPGDILPDEPGLAAWLSGLWASLAGLPDPFPGARIRQMQKRQLGVALPWAAESLGLPPPEPVTDEARTYMVGS